MLYSEDRRHLAAVFPGSLSEFPDTPKAAMNSSAPSKDSRSKEPSIPCLMPDSFLHLRSTIHLLRASTQLDQEFNGEQKYHPEYVLKGTFSV